MHKTWWGKIWVKINLIVVQFNNNNVGPKYHTYVLFEDHFRVMLIYHKFDDLNAKLGGWSNFFIRKSFQ